MKYIALVYQEMTKLETVSDSELDSMIAECGGWVEELETSGRHIFSAGLQSTVSAVTLRSLTGRLSVTDGPFAETKEILGGFTVFVARDLNEAISIASNFPPVRWGSVEVRPVLDLEAVLVDPMDQRVAASIRRSAHEPSAV